MGKLGTFIKGAPLSKADITETGTPLILYGELYTTYGDIATTIVRKTDKEVKSECYSILGDVIIPTSGESPEEISTCTCVMQDGVILAGDLYIYRTNDVDGRFLSYEINHIRNREIAKIAQGKSIVHIRADELEKIVIRFPSKTEQSKIIEIFSYLDKKVEIQKELINSLKLYKRGLLSKLFPKNKANQPELRFCDFADDWVQRKLGEIAEIVGGGTPNTNISDYWDGDIDWYSPIEIADQIYLKSSQRKITEQGFNHSSAKILPAGTVLFTSRAGIGKTAILSQKGCTNQGFQSIVPHKNELDSYFIFSRTDELKRYGETVGSGSTFIEVSGKQMANMELMMPKTMMEQQIIGTYFRTLDHLITLHLEKYASYKKIKYALLQKMFI